MLFFICNKNLKQNNCKRKGDKMKKLFLMLFIAVLFNIVSYSMTWEIGLQVLTYNSKTQAWEPLSIDVYLYKSYGFYYDQYRHGVTNTDPGVNGVFDVIYCNNPANTDKYLWLPIEPGTYYLRIDNFYCYFTFIDPDCNQGLGSPDVTIKYTYGNFTLLNTN
jgi:hypothetical protein